jgi:hypothetical protein
VLSLLWLGLGHLYAGKPVVGVLLMIYDLVLALIAVTGVGLIVAVPVWLVSALVVAILAANAAANSGRRARTGY